MATSKIVFGCLKHRTVVKTIEPEPNKIIWVDVCRKDTNIRIHTTGLTEDLLNRRGIVSNLDTTFLSLCNQDVKSETRETPEKDCEVGRKRSSMYTGPVFDESSKSKEQKLDLYIPGRRKSRIPGRRVSFTASNNPDKINSVNEFIPGERYGGKRNYRQPGRLICEK